MSLCAKLLIHHGDTESVTEETKKTKDFSVPPRFRGELNLSLRLQFERCRVHAIPQSCRPGAIRKDVPEMSVAAAAKHFNAAHAVFVIFFGRDVLVLNRLVETGPATSGLVLRVGTEQLLATADAGVSSRLLLRVVLSAKRRFRSALPRYAELFIGQLRPPLGVALANLFRHANPYQIRCANHRFDSSQGCGVARACSKAWPSRRMMPSSK